MSANTPSYILLANNLLHETKLLEATRVIQAALLPGRSTPESMSEDALEHVVRKSTAAFEDKRFPQPDGTLVDTHKPVSRWSSHLRRPLAQTLGMLRNARAPDLPSGNPIPRIITNMDPLPAGATFASHSFSTAEGSRNYKLYVPGRRPHASPRPLLVMLHGCTQNADDFAAGTGMNLLAEELNFLVAYPEQSTAANKMKCWSWFSDSDQHRGAGEPSIIASITRKLIADHDIDPTQVFVTGFSAGGAMAAVLGATYPDVFSAIGVHSGLPYKAASDVPSAFAAMQNVHHVPFEPALREGRLPRLIVFHGEHDKTVHPENGQRLFAARCRPERANIDQLQSIKGARGDHTRTVLCSPTGAPLAEHWLIHGGGHAWSGGRPHGSYTQPGGPGASREMLRFFVARNGDMSAVV